MHTARHADTAMLGEPFQPCRHVDAVAEDVSFINDDIADVNADAKLDTAIFGNCGITLSHGTLDFHGATGCVDRTRKFDQSTVARCLDHTTTVFCDLGIDQFSAPSLKGCESTFLVDAHQAAIARNIGRKDCC